MVCDKELQCIKKYNLQRHYFLCHTIEYDKFQGEEHDALLTELKERADLEDYQNSESSVHLSYRIALHIAKKLRPFTEGNFAKEIIVMAAEEKCPHLVEKFERVSLSPKTIMHRIQEMVRIYRKNSVIWHVSLSIFPLLSMKVLIYRILRN